MRPIILAWSVWALTVAGIIVLMLVLTGCQTTVKGLCAFKHIGTNSAGVNFVQYQCEPVKEES